MNDPWSTISDIYQKLAASCGPMPHSGCVTSWRPIPVTAGAAATPGRTPAWTPVRCGSGCALTRTGTGCQPNGCADLRLDHGRTGLRQNDEPRLPLTLGVFTARLVCVQFLQYTELRDEAR